MTDTPAIGTIGVSRIGGRTGWLIARGQSFIGSPSLFTHAFIVVSERHVLQAMPGGAEIVPIDPYLEPRAAVFLHGWYELNADQEAVVRTLAFEFEGTPYNFLDYLYLAWPPAFCPEWLKRRIASTNRMICSQLVDRILEMVGVNLFQEEEDISGRKRDHARVTPGDIHNQWTYAVASP